jgi:MFS family permease
VNYGWVIVGVGVLVKMSGLGFGRFAYPILLPFMKGTLGFNYSQMGLLSGGIMLGYLLFSFVGGRLAAGFGSKKVVVCSLLCSSLSMLLLSIASGLAPMLLFTFAMGAGAAGAHIAMTTLPMAWFQRNRLGGAVGVVTGGTGLGIIVVSLLVPPLLSTLGSEAWRDCWRLMALITFSIFVTGMLLLKERRIPPSSLTFERADAKRKKESPPEKDCVVMSLQGSETTEAISQGIENKEMTTQSRRGGLSIRSIFIVYFIFGFAYNIYTTYFVSYLVDELGIGRGTAGVIWSTFGWTCIGSGLVWGFLSDRLGRRRALLWNNGIIALAVAVPLLFHQAFLLGVSTFLFGATFLGTVTIVAASVGDQVGEKQAAVYGLITLVHGFGQLMGTTLGGFMKDLSGSFQLTFLSSLAGFLLCIALTALSRQRSESKACEKM